MSPLRPPALTGILIATFLQLVTKNRTLLILDIEVIICSFQCSLDIEEQLC